MCIIGHHERVSMNVLPEYWQGHDGKDFKRCNASPTNANIVYSEEVLTRMTGIAREWLSEWQPADLALPGRVLLGVVWNS